MAYESEHWEYVQRQFDADNIARSITLAQASNTETLRPEDRDALQARIDTALAARNAFKPDGLERHDKDEQDENDELLIASIVGAVLLVFMTLYCCYKYVSMGSPAHGDH